MCNYGYTKNRKHLFPTHNDDSAVLYKIIFQKQFIKLRNIYKQLLHKSFVNKKQNPQRKNETDHWAFIFVWIRDPKTSQSLD